MLLQFRPAFINITSLSSSHSSHSRSKYRTYADENTASQSGHGTSTAPNVYPSSSRNGGKRRSASWKFSIPASVSSPTTLSASHQSQPWYPVGGDIPFPFIRLELPFPLPANDNNTSEAGRILVRPWTWFDPASSVPLSMISFPNSNSRVSVWTGDGSGTATLTFLDWIQSD